jgi:hypothetical protein
MWTKVRVWDTKIGRYLSRDPAGPALALNMYECAGSNPVVFIDPNGDWPWDIIRCFYRWGKIIEKHGPCKAEYPYPDENCKCQGDWKKKIMNCIDRAIGKKNYTLDTLEICARAGILKKIPGCGGRL